MVVINRSAQAQSVTVPVHGYLPNGVTFAGVYGVNNSGIGLRYR